MYILLLLIHWTSQLLLRLHHRHHLLLGYKLLYYYHLDNPVYRPHQYQDYPRLDLHSMTLVYFVQLHRPNLQDYLDLMC
jgi:hypothetical protein